MRRSTLPGPAESRGIAHAMTVAFLLQQGTRAAESVRRFEVWGRVASRLARGLVASTARRLETSAFAPSNEAAMR